MTWKDAYASARFGLVALLFVDLGSGCGGGDGGGPTTPPPVTPVVTTVVVSPATAPLLRGDSVLLAVVVKDQNGATMSGKTPSWTTTAAAVATVSSLGMVTAVGAGQATITATVEGKTGSALVTVAPDVELDAGRIGTATIGPSGGTVSVTASSGVLYTLDVPPGALIQPATISITPIVALRTLKGVTVEGAAQFQPTGLTFRVPVTLKIHKTVSVASGNQLAGVVTDDAGGSIALTSARQEGGDVVVTFTHFSSAGAAQGTPTQLNQLPTTPAAVPATLDSYEAGIAALNRLRAIGEDNQPLLEVFFHQWFEEWVAPEIRKAEAEQNNVPFAAMGAAEIALAWAGEWPPAFASHRLVDVDVGRRLLANAFVAHVRVLARTGENAVSPTFLPVFLAMEMHTVISDLRLDSQFPDELSIAAIERDLHVTVVITDSTFPSPAPPGQPAALSLRAGLKYGNNANLANAGFRFDMSVIGGTPSTESGNSDAGGRYSTSVTPSGLGPLELRITYCAKPPPSFGAPPAAFGADIFCARPTIQRVNGRTITAQVNIQSDAGLAQIADVSKIEGSLTISGPNVTSTDLRELALLSEVTGTITLMDLPALTTLSGLRSLSKVSVLTLTRNPALRNPAIPPGLKELSALFVTGGVNDLSGFSGLTQIGALLLQDLQLTTLNPLRQTPISRQLGVSRVTGLTSLNGLNLASSLEELLFQDNPDLTDISALSVVTEVRSLRIFRERFASVPGFENLQRITGGLDIHANAQTPGFSFPALQSIGLLSINLSSGGCQGRTSPFALGLPALQTLIRLNYVGSSSSAPSCFTGLPASISNLSLESVNVVGGGLTSLTLKHVQNSPVQNSNGGISVRNALDLTHLSFSSSIDINGNLIIAGNPKLPSIGFGGSVIIRGPGAVPNSGGFTICNNQALTSLSFGGAGVTVSGAVHVSFNPLLPLPTQSNPWPITATAGQVITQQFTGCS